MVAEEIPTHRPWAVLLEELCQAHNESYRQASLAAGLDHGAVHRFVKGNRRPHRESCIALAHHFGLNPNELLAAAGHEPLPWFDPSLVNPGDYPFEVKQVAETLIRIASPRLRREVCEALQALAGAVLAGQEQPKHVNNHASTANNRSKGGAAS
jgi:hypothetical protein